MKECRSKISFTVFILIDAPGALHFFKRGALISSPQNIEISESEWELDSDINESESDYDSPGH